MSKVKVKQASTVVSPETNKQTKCDKGKAKAVKKRKYFYKYMDPKPKEAKNTVWLPPRDAAEFSANWKSLLLSHQVYQCILETERWRNEKYKQLFSGNVASPSLLYMNDKDEAEKALCKFDTLENVGEDGKKNSLEYLLSFVFSEMKDMLVFLENVLNSEENLNTKKLKSLPIKESNKCAQSNNEDTNQAAVKDLKKSLNCLKQQESKVAGMEQRSNCHKQHKTEKRKMNDVEGRKKQADKRKKVENTEKTPTEADIWFDDIDPNDIEAAIGSEAANIVRKRSGVTPADAKTTERSTEQLLVKESTCDGLTRAIAMDCEMVGVGPGGEESILARVSIVNYFGKCVYDKYVKPTEKVTDYRTAVSGIRPGDVEHGENFKVVQQEVAKILEGRILVGHAIHNDLKILLLDHPKRNTRDTQKYKPFKKIVKSGRPALRVLCREILNVKVQQGEHSSVQDAQAAMRLYTLVKKKWEAELKASRGQTTSQKSSRKPRAKPDLGTA